MQEDSTLLTVSLIFTGAAALAAVALFARQSLLVAYIALGALLGPWGFRLVTDTSVIAQIGQFGIIFLLFLLGLNLHPQKLLQLLREATLVTVISSAAFSLTGALVSRALGFGVADSLLAGVTMMFSSTIVSLKLLPTTALHHRHMGEIIISVLLLQDILAIFILLVLQGLANAAASAGAIVLLLLSLPVFAAFALLFERHVLVRLITRFDAIREYIFLTAVGWCLGLAELAHALGLSYEIGAFVAGVALATNRISYFIAESLKPLRDFFLIMFFFSLGASFPLPVLPQVALPAVLLALALLLVKPLVFHWLLRWENEPKPLAREIGWRLGQASEFSLLIAVLAVDSGVLGERASQLVQTATLITFLVSSYIVMLRFPTPIAVSDRLRSD